MTLYRHDPYRHAYKHKGSAGTTWCFQIGGLHVSFSRERGLYGYEDTVSWAVRWWVA